MSRLPPSSWTVLPQGDTTVVINSSNPSVASTQNLTIPNGQTSGSVLVTGWQQGTTTLSATWA